MAKTTGATHKILAMGVQLTTRVATCDINIRLVDESENLGVVIVIKHLDARNGTRDDSSTTMTLLRAPTNFFALSVTNCRIRFGGGEHAKV
jgi:hypothetical protein